LDTTLLSAIAPKQTFPVGPKAPTVPDGAVRVGGKGYWTNYRAIEAAGVHAIEVEPHITVWSYDGGATWCLRLDMVFDPNVWDTAKLGLIYGDPTFEHAVRAWWERSGFAVVGNGPTYTEQGMQEDDSVSMECGVPPLGQWSDLFASAHTALLWLRNGPTAGWTIQLEPEDA
jgi:hypothetical protein